MDDEAVNLKLFDAFLIPQGYDVLHVHSGRQVLEMIQEQKVDLVLLDIMMPEMNGYDVCRKIKADLAHVNLQNYIETMTAHIRVQFGADRDIHFQVQAAVIEVDLDIAIPYGLILNELIANACKHAFPEDKPRSGAGNCEISVVMGQENGMLMLTVADNGVGLPAGVNWKNPETVGLQLVRMLSQQLNGSIELDRSVGTVFSLKFPVPGKIN